MQYNNTNNNNGIFVMHMLRKIFLFYRNNIS